VVHVLAGWVFGNCDYSPEPEPGAWRLPLAERIGVAELAPPASMATAAAIAMMRTQATDGIRMEFTFR
jgi:hypothetical protein